ncbi:MAG TPA: hypothetical protein VFT69_08660 [Pseudolabrys sp.]|nr:hypothetical protein [Pseudolabrys sp.]
MTTSILPICRLLGGGLLLAGALALAGCETTGIEAPTAEAAPAPAPITHQKAALYCWMKTEHGRADIALDKRADIVDRCIKEKMQGG